MSRELLLGIDLGGTNCRAALAGAEGGLEESRRMETRIGDGLEDFLGRLTAMVRDLLAVAEARKRPVRALGIGVPGVIGRGGRVAVSPNLPPLNGVPLAEQLCERLGLPVVSVNDANAIAWGETLFGAGRPFGSSLTLTLGTGVGGGLILDRRLWEGADGAAGEAGHIMVEPEGRSCGCGSRGCLEQYASASGISKTVREGVQAGRASALEGLAELSSRRIAEAARGGDVLAREAYSEAGRRLGQVLAGVANLLNLDAAIIGGGASGGLDLMRPALEQEIRERAFPTVVRRLQVVRGELGDDAGILGAAHLALERSAQG